MNRKERRGQQQINNVSQPVASVKKQEAEGSEVYTNNNFSWAPKKVTTALIEQYAESALLAEPLKNCKDLIFANYEDHPTPWITVKDPEGNIDDGLSKEGQQIAKVCDFYSAHIQAYMDQELGGCSVWSPGWGTIEGVTGICPVELRNLPWNSFRDLPAGFTDVYNDIMPGIVIDKATGKVRAFQKPDDRSPAVEIQNFFIVRDPTAPKPSGKPGCKPVIALITNYDYADKAWNQKMNRVAAPSIFPYVDRITKTNKEYVEAIGKKWGKDTCFILTEGMDFKDPHLVESSTAEERLAWLTKRVASFYNPSSFLQKDGNTIGGSDSGAAGLINKMIAATLSCNEKGLGEKLLQDWLNKNGFKGYSVEVRFPRPETRDDAQALAEITEANKNGHISRAEARQKYPNLDLPELTPEEEAKLDAEYKSRQPQQANMFAGFGQAQPTVEQPVGNLGSSPGPLVVEDTQAYKETAAALVAARRKWADTILEGLKKGGDT